MSPSELKELLESLGSQKGKGLWVLTRTKWILADGPLAIIDEIALKEEIRLALREEGLREYRCLELTEGRGFRSLVDGRLFPSNFAEGPDELHALATLWKKVKV